MSGYVKIYGSQLIRSTVWVNTNKETKLVWITMLAIADKHGMVLTSIPGLAKDAGVSVAECEESLAVLSAPDSYSRTKDYEGRRIEDVDGGFLLLNYEKYREMRTEAQVKDAKRKAAWRAKRAAESPEEAHIRTAGPVPPVTPSPAMSRTTPSSTPSPSPPPPPPYSVGMDLIPTRDHSIVAKSILASLEQIGKIEIAAKHLLIWQSRAVFAYWIGKFNKDNARTKLSHGRWARLERYIRLYGIETCLYAIDGAAIHPHMNHEDGRTFHEFEEIFMNKPDGPGRVEKLSEYARERDKRSKHRLLEKHPELEGVA